MFTEFTLRLVLLLEALRLLVLDFTMLMYQRCNGIKQSRSENLSLSCWFKRALCLSQTTAEIYIPQRTPLVFLASSYSAFSLLSHSFLRRRIWLISLFFAPRSSCSERAPSEEKPLLGARAEAIQRLRSLSGRGDWPSPSRTWAKRDRMSQGKHSGRGWDCATPWRQRTCSNGALYENHRSSATARRRRAYKAVVPRRKVIVRPKQINSDCITKWRPKDSNHALAKALRKSLGSLFGARILF